jgi:hypothetical protein
LLNTLPSFLELSVLDVTDTDKLLCTLVRCDQTVRAPGPPKRSFPSVSRLLVEWRRTFRCDRFAEWWTSTIGDVEFHSSLFVLKSLLHFTVRCQQIGLIHFYFQLCHVKLNFLLYFHPLVVFGAISYDLWGVPHNTWCSLYPSANNEIRLSVHSITATEHDTSPSKQYLIMQAYEPPWTNWNTVRSVMRLGEPVF